ncbi:MAG: magnesium and cobalt transport protein CorA [Bacteroidetes bacterium]|nr:magnesium and cobalt transport protein CorA [Bacteroidota bacterium]
MVSILQYINGEIKRLTLKELSQCVHSPEGVLWVDLENPLEAEEETLLVSVFDFHPLAIEDAQRGSDEEGHLPKVEDFGEYLFVIFNPVEVTAGNGVDEPRGGFEIKTTQLSSFLSKRVLVTHHYTPLRSISNAQQLLAKNPKALARGPDFLFHMIIDELVDNYTPILDHLDDLMDDMEREVFHDPTQATMIRILQMRGNITTLRRVAFYQREMLNRLSRGEFSLITRDEMLYYRNVYDHLVRMTDLTESYRETVGGLLDAYLSVTSNKLSQVMKVLTIISTIFLPLSVITGFFGMNFAHLPGLGSPMGVILTTLSMLIVAGGMLWAFRRNKWI